MTVASGKSRFRPLDERFEVLAVTQTRKVKPMPIVLAGERFWRRAVNINFLVEEGVIDVEDRDSVLLRRDARADLG